jgi:hypothetical protein
MIEDYLAKAQACRTENLFNRLHIRLEENLAPPEVAALGRAARRPDFPEAGRAWLAGLGEKTPGLMDAPEAFERREISDRVVFYEGQGGSTPRRLLIAFTGKARRMMLPTPTFLQALDAAAWDVVLLKRTKSFLEGLDGEATDFDGVVAYLRRAFIRADYSGVATIGTSGGGGFAVVAALKLKADRGVSISGTVNAAVLALAPRRNRLMAFLRGTPRLCFVHASDFASDRRAANRMIRAWGGRRREVTGVEEHNVVWPLQQRGELKSLLKEVL